jgi:hypothetical protein
VNHAEVIKNLADYLEGDLSLDDRAVVDAHLDTCSECAREVAELEQTVRLLRSLPEPETPPMIAANVMRRIRAGETRLGFFGRVRRSVSAVLEPTFMLPASAVAVAAFVVVVVQDPGRFGLTDEVASPVAERAELLDAGTPFAAVPRPAMPPSTMGFTASAMAPVPARERGFAVDFDRRAAASDGATGLLAGGPPPTLVSGGKFGRTPLGQAVPVAAMVPSSAMGLRAEPGYAPVAVHSGGEDPRDGWIALGLERPADFARFLADKSLAEQELWVGRLADRAESRGLLDELVETLEEMPDEIAALLATDFAAEAAQLRADSR